MSVTLGPKKLLRAKDVAEILGIPVATARNKIRSGFIPSIRGGPGTHRYVTDATMKEMFGSAWNEWISGKIQHDEEDE